MSNWKEQAKKEAIKYLESANNSKNITWEECMEGINIALDITQKEIDKTRISYYQQGVLDNKAEVERLKKVNKSLKEQLKGSVEHKNKLLAEKREIKNMLNEYESEYLRKTPINIIPIPYKIIKIIKKNIKDIEFKPRQKQCNKEAGK